MKVSLIVDDKSELPRRFHVAWLEDAPIEIGGNRMRLTSVLFTSTADEHIAIELEPTPAEWRLSDNEITNIRFWTKETK